MKQNLLLTGSVALICTNLFSANRTRPIDQRPNILWLTFEDTSASELGCYGNKDVQTPVIDSLAAKGIQYMNVWSSAPQSSPARSSLITGCYATTFGMDVHPVPQITPEHIFFPSLLRDAGYYCINNDKTHYNSITDNRICWDESSPKASYSSSVGKENRPFFAVFNTVTSHMGRIRTFHVDNRRDYSKEGILKEELNLPPHVPDLPEVRSDYAGHLEAVQDVDKWVGLFLHDLKEKGLDDNTIVFVFSDHGGCLPRGKGYLYETGLKIPLIVYLPPKWQHLTTTKPGTKDYTPIDFTDFAPTLLSITGVKIPKFYQGVSFLGEKASVKKKSHNIGFAANQLHHYMPMRAASDGRFKYIRSYIPYKQFALRNYYQWGMPSNMAWDSLWLNELIDDKEALRQPYVHHRHEMLFDLTNDPSELHDLSTDPLYQKELKKLRKIVSDHVRSTKDLGFFIPSFRERKNLFEMVRGSKYPLAKLQVFAELAGNPEIKDLKNILRHLKSDDPNFRFWAAVAMSQLGLTKQYDKCPDELLQLLDDENPHVAAEAAYACACLGNPELGIKTLIASKNEADIKIYYSLLECLSLDKNMHSFISNYRDLLENQACNLPYQENEDAGLMARGILVNIGAWKTQDIYREKYNQGLKLNRGRRPMLPLP